MSQCLLSFPPWWRVSHYFFFNPFAKVSEAARLQKKQDGEVCRERTRREE